MKKIIISTFFFSIALTLPVNAGSYFSGQVEYLQQCRSCHGRSQTFVGVRTIDKWNEILKDDAASLKQIHKDLKEGEELKKYLQSKLFKKKLKYIKIFVTLFAKDGKRSPSEAQKH